jgi:hypothetical protein
MKKIYSIFLSSLGFLEMNAQCAMCKATVEQSDNVAGINEGILYLMPLPAIIISVFGIIIYVNYKKKKAI